jgi:hypothetical protein
VTAGDEQADSEECQNMSFRQGISPRLVGGHPAPVAQPAGSHVAKLTV